MWRNALFATAIVVVAAAYVIFLQIDCWKPYKHLIIPRLGLMAGIFFLLLSVNLMAFFFWLTRKLLLKDVGMRHRHAKKQVAHGELMPELGDRLAEEQ